MKNVIGMGSLKHDPALIDFAWIGDNGAFGQYKDFTSFTGLRKYLEAHGYPHVMLEWHGDDFAVVAPGPAWQPSA
jgi:hypothetical protein